MYMHCFVLHASPLLLYVLQLRVDPATLF